jgi:hypothetical protein
MKGRATMQHESSTRLSWGRGLALACITLLGVLSIVGSGGGGDSNCILAPGPCPGDFPLEPATPIIEPPTLVVQVGASATFAARADDISAPTYQWSRTPRGGATAPIPGATGATYTVDSANLADDGAVFSVRVAGTFDGKAVAVESRPAWLAVSSMPGVVLQDTEFRLADWSVAALSEPATGGPTFAVAQEAAGGNPGAYRRTNITLPAGPARLDLFQTYLPATYDPGTQGPVYFIDFKQACLTLPGTMGASTSLLVEQAGRRYVAGGPMLCGASVWNSKMLIPGTYAAADFTQVGGPACAGQACPDFTATGAPIRFGFASFNATQPGIAGVSGGFGLDNWQVTVWRR